MDFLSLKNKEIVMILLRTNPDLNAILFDVSDPGKIDLACEFSSKSFKEDSILAYIFRAV